MRADLLRRRNELKNEVEELNKAQENCDKDKSFEISKQREISKGKYIFINNLMKAIK